MSFRFIGMKDICDGGVGNDKTSRGFDSLEARNSLSEMDLRDGEVIQMPNNAEESTTCLISC